MTLKDKFTLLTVGQLHRQKNQIVCLEALKKILPEIPEAVLVIVRDGPMKSFLEEKTHEWNLEDHVRFVGFVSNEELRDLYHACDINLFPALDQSWGLTPFEALAAGKISIVSEDSGAAEVIRKENIGLVCPPTAEAFAEKILEVYHAESARRAGTSPRHPELDSGSQRSRFRNKFGMTNREPQQMATRGQQYVKQNLTWENYANRTLQILSSVPKE